MSSSNIPIAKKTQQMIVKKIVRNTFLSKLIHPKSNQKHVFDEKFKNEAKGSEYLDAIQTICDHRKKQTSMEMHEAGIFIEIKYFSLESHVATLHMLKNYTTRDPINENLHNSFGIAYYSSLCHSSVSENVVAVLKECFVHEENE